MMWLIPHFCQIGIGWTVLAKPSASTFATAWAQDRAGVSGAESITTSAGDVSSSNLQGQPQQTNVSFYEKNKTAIMIAGGVAGLGVLFLALKR
jgi:hypothetical protein